MRVGFWLREGLKIVGIILAGTALYTLLMSGLPDWSAELRTAAIYMESLTAFILIALGWSIYRTYIPMVLSLGSTRKEVLVGLQLYRLMVAAPVLAVAAILLAFAEPMEGLSNWCFTVLGVAAVLYMNGIGGWLGTLSVKLSIKAMNVVLVAVMLLSALVAIFAGIICIVFLQELGVWVLLILGGVVYGLCSIGEIKTVRRFCVR